MSHTTVDSTTFREIVGHFPTGVVVVTSNLNGEPLGMTLQSFVSLSLEPPLILLSVARSSKTWPRIAETGRFAVNILSEGQGQLARQFARSGGDKFDGVALKECSASCGPILQDAVAWIDCEVRSEYDGGDHIIVVADVKDLGLQADEPGVVARALVFHRSAFARVGHHS